MSDSDIAAAWDAVHENSPKDSVTDGVLEEFREFDEIVTRDIAFKPGCCPRGAVDDGVLWWEARGYDGSTGEPVNWLFRLDSSGWTTFDAACSSSG